MKKLVPVTEVDGEGLSGMSSYDMTVLRDLVNYGRVVMPRGQKLRACRRLAKKGLAKECHGGKIFEITECGEVELSRPILAAECPNTADRPL